MRLLWRLLNSVQQAYMRILNSLIVFLSMENVDVMNVLVMIKMMSMMPAEA